MNNKPIEPEPLAQNLSAISCNIINECSTDVALDTKIHTNKVSEVFYNAYFANVLPNKIIEYSLLLTDDLNIQQLNRDFRGKDAPTNVLSFPQYQLVDGNIKQLGDEAENIINLGDIAVSIPTLIAESCKQNKLLEHHFCHLLLHSLLHLIGYDHQEDSAHVQMMQVETNLLKKLNINNPYTI